MSRVKLNLALVISMAILISIPSIRDDRGALSVVTNELGFKIQRVFWVYDCTAIRGGHAHRITKNALICVAGECNIRVKKQGKEENFPLQTPEQCLVLDPEDWHTMEFADKNSVLLVLSSEPYREDDYVYAEK